MARSWEKRDSMAENTVDPFEWAGEPGPRYGNDDAAMPPTKSSNSGRKPNARTAELPARVTESDADHIPGGRARSCRAVRAHTTGTPLPLAGKNWPAGIWISSDDNQT